MKCIHVFFVIFLLFIGQVIDAQHCNPDSTRRYQLITGQAPTNFICKVIVYKSKIARAATASFVFGNILIGAGHTFKENLFSKIKYVTIVVGLHKENGVNKWLFWHTYKRNELRILVRSRYRGDKDISTDCAFVALPEKITATFFRLNNLDSLRDKIDSVCLTGYPGDKNAGEIWQRSDSPSNLYKHKSFLLYSLYSGEGDSGGPLWCRYKDLYYIIGIHVQGKFNRGNCNASIRINERVGLLLQKFINKNGL